MTDYPPDVQTPEQRERWDLARKTAEGLWPGDPAMIWSATRTIYKSDIPTGEAK